MKIPYIDEEFDTLIEARSHYNKMNKLIEGDDGEWLLVQIIERSKR